LIAGEGPDLRVLIWKVVSPIARVALFPTASSFTWQGFEVVEGVGRGKLGGREGVGE
jgi:hypothetical protein